MDERWKAAEAKQATMDRPIMEALKKAYLAGIEGAENPGNAGVGQRGIQEELDEAYSNMKESMKDAMRATTRSPLGLPLGHFSNLSAGLWEFAYWWGAVVGANKKTASVDPWKADQPRQAAEIETPNEVFYGIMGREKGKGKMKPFDYANGRFVTNVIYQTLWGDKRHVESLVDEMNKMNQDYEFVVKKRT